MEPTAAAAEPARATPVQQPATAALTIEMIRARQNFGLAALAGLGAALGGAVAWAIVTVVTEMKLGLMAIAVGYAVGQAIRATGKGIDKQFGILGAACSLFGCVIGNALSVIAFFAKANHIDFGVALGRMTPDILIRLMTVTFDPMDLLFYAIAIYEGYKFSFRYRAL